MSTVQADGIPDPQPWFEENVPFLFDVAMLRTRNADLAEEIAQQASLKILRAWPDKRQRDLIITSRGYVYKIVLNIFLDHLEAASRTRKHEIPLEPDHDKASEDADIAFRELLFALAEDERAMLTLCYYFRMTILEAGRQLGLTKDGAYRLHTRARETLRARLQDMEN